MMIDEKPDVSERCCCNTELWGLVGRFQTRQSLSNVQVLRTVLHTSTVGAASRAVASIRTASVGERQHVCLSCVCMNYIDKPMSCMCACYVVRIVHTLNVCCCCCCPLSVADLHRLSKQDTESYLLQEKWPLLTSCQLMKCEEAGSLELHL